MINPESRPAFMPGDRVILISSGECGIVVHTWASDELGGAEDCYVAFFGPQFPALGVRPAEIPYVLRYAASSIRRAPR
jgi:hypothetical protein